MLDIIDIDCVEDPVETEDGIDEHGGVVDPAALVSENGTEKTRLGGGVKKTCGG